jgi:hypothetical protein
VAEKVKQNNAVPAFEPISEDIYSVDPTTLDLLRMDQSYFHYIPEDEITSEKETKALQDHLDLVNDLIGEGGIVIREVVNQLALRINTLVENDPETLAYKKILDKLGYKLDVGNKIAQHLVKQQASAEAIQAMEK